jgi:SWI2/SNF2 ATPase
LRAACEPTRFLDLIENFLLFEDARGGLRKLLAKYHQVLGVNRAIEAVKQIVENKSRLGVFWHTQGAGKSFSMVMFTEKVLRHLKALDKGGDRPTFGLPEALLVVCTPRLSCRKAGKARIFMLVRESSGEIPAKLYSSSMEDPANVAREACIEAKAPEQIPAGVGRHRVVFIVSGGRVSNWWAGGGCADDAEHRNESRNYSQ